MGLKIFGTGGIDQKANDLKRDPQKLRYAENMMASDRNEYVKRAGTEADTDFLSEPYNDVQYIKSLDEYFYWDGTDYVVYKDGIRSIPYKYGTGATALSNISIAEYLNTAIFTHETNQIQTMKYDHQAVYAAGLPTPTITSPTAGSLYAIYFYQFIDGQGNTVYGPATIVPSVDSTGSFTVDTFNNSQFYGGYLKIDVSTTISFGPLLRTLSYDSKSPDIIVGSRVTFRTVAEPVDIFIVQFPSTGYSTSKDFIQLVVESINTSTKVITFTADSFQGCDIIIQPATGGVGIYNVCSSLTIRYYFSTEETTGYYGYLSNDRYAILDNSVATMTFTYDTANLDTSILMSDIYDITTSKLRPPRCTYVYTYGYQIVCSGALAFWDFGNKEILYNNNDLIMYSDVSTGDIGENFTESNRQLIGNTYDGQLTGQVRTKDSMIEFKNRSVFSLDGVLIPGQFSLRKIESNEIGCLSSKSILTIDDGLLFQGQDGIYFTDGYKVKKTTQELDVFFKTVDPTQTRSVVNNVLDQYVFWTNQGVVIYDYQFDQWYIWKGIDASKGITVNNDNSIRLFQSSSATQFINDKNDNGVAIDAYIDTAWFDLGEPSILKIITDIRLFCLNNLGQDVSITIFWDWSESNARSPITFSMDADVKTQLRKVDIVKAQSFSFRIRNNTLNQDLNISGYDVVCNVIQTRDKNVK